MGTVNLTGDDLRRWRESLDLTQDQVAALLQISREWIGKLERGDRKISAEVFLRFEQMKRDPQFAKGTEAISSLVVRTPQLAGTSPHAPQAIEAGTNGGLRSLPSSADIASESRAIFDQLVVLAGESVSRQNWLREQLQSILPPRHWIAEDKYDAKLERLFAEMRDAREDTSKEEAGA